jgi:hypothetical protein
LWGDKKTENRKGKPMRSILTLTLAGLIAATTLAPAAAATKNRRKAPAQTEENLGEGWQQTPVAARPGAPGAIYQQPYACFTDEGYGRYTSCDVGGY